MTATDFKAKGGSFHAHLFENRTTGLPRNLYWSATVQFAPIDCLGHSWESGLTIEWLSLGARRFSGTHPASPRTFPLGEASLYLVAEHHLIEDWTCIWTWDARSPVCRFSFDVTINIPDLDSEPVRGLRLAGTTELAFDGFIVVADNLEPKPSGIVEAEALLAHYFDAPLSGTDEGWRYTFAPKKR